MSPRVTVLLAVKDGLPWLQEAVNSVLAQTYRDFELLVVDDASTDGTAAALEAYADPRIRVLRNERNLGQVPSLNSGLREARGDYVARLDADDVCLPQRLERQAAVLDVEPAVALVGGWMDVIDERGKPWGKLRGQVRDFPEFLAAILTDRYPWGHPSIMFRREVVLALGGYDPTLAPSEDKDLYRRLALGRHDARGIEEVLVRYRRHEAQLSQEQAQVQLRHDRESQERFVAELTGGGSATPELLADGAARRLGLDEAQRVKLLELLERHHRRRGPLLPGARRVLGAPPLLLLRRLARRSRLLRSLYSRLG